MSEVIRILLADDHEIFRDGFKAMLRKQKTIELIGEAENGEQLIQMAKDLKPDVIVTDILMPVMDGLQATKILSKELPWIGVIALSMLEEKESIMDMVEAGAKGYLLKNAHKQEIIMAIHRVYEKQEYYCENTLAKVARDLVELKERRGEPKETFPDFSDRDIAVIRYICEELTNKEIADKMNLSVRTIEGYRERIQSKIKAKNSVGIVVYAIRNNLFQ